MKKIPLGFFTNNSQTLLLVNFHPIAINQKQILKIKKKNRKFIRNYSHHNVILHLGVIWFVVM